MNYKRPFVALILALLMIYTAPTMAQNIDAKEYWLDNGMQVLMIERHESPTILGTIIARVGSANEKPGITGISHLFEHMMFKGTETIGTRDIEKDREVMARLDSLRALMLEEEKIMRENYRRGLIDDMLAPESKTERYKEIEKVFDSLIIEQRELIIKDQMDEIYAKHGGFFFNAFTSDDVTAYMVRLPKNKIELYMWLESDRFMNPVFREFYSERDVVREERRLGVDATPTGLIEEEFRAMFWKSASYSWDVIGWPSDIGSITRDQADDYFDTYYTPNNLTLLLVGDLEPDKMIGMVKKYFERIPKGTVDPPDVVTLEEKQYGEKRLISTAEANPRAELWFHAPAWKHKDSYPLKVLAGILKGKTGRLYKKLVEEKAIALGTSPGRSRMFGGDNLGVNADMEPLKYGGVFKISAEGVSGVKPEELELAILDVIEELKSNPVTEEELQKVKNQMRMADIRMMEIMSGIGILFIMVPDIAYGDWAETNNRPLQCDKVTTEDVMHVANKYFAPDQRNVMIINANVESKSDTGGDPMMMQIMQMIENAADAEKLEKMIGMMSMQMEQTEDPKQKIELEKILKAAGAKLKELKDAESN